VENNEMIVSSRINYHDYQQLNRIRLNRIDKGKHPSISELVREAITQYIGENK
jgi:Arc/MetJ-type ribon-helix-helix transcriptional regulator